MDIDQDKPVGAEDSVPESSSPADKRAVLGLVLFVAGWIFWIAALIRWADTGLHTEPSTITSVLISLGYVSLSWALGLSLMSLEATKTDPDASKMPAVLVALSIVSQAIMVFTFAY